MKLQIARATLLQVLQGVQTITEQKSHMPILGNALIQALPDNQVRFFATDLELSYRTLLQAQVENPGSITVSARKLLEITRELPHEWIHLEELPNRRVVVRAGRSRFELATIPVEDFPHLAFYEEGEFYSFKRSEIEDGLEKTLSVIPVEDDPFNIAGLYWYPLESGQYRLLASDGHRLTYVQGMSENFTSMEIADGIVIPRKGVQELLRHLEKEVEFELAVRENSLILRTPESLLTIRLLDEEFPDYQQIIPEQRPFSILVERSELLQALKRMAILTSQKWRHVRLMVKNGILELQSDNPDIGNATDALDIEYEGDDFNITFNIRYVLEAIQPMKSQKVCFEWVDEVHGGIFTGSEDPGYLALIMPMII
jgi:DNA polymerase III subunit beta